VDVNPELGEGILALLLFIFVTNRKIVESNLDTFYIKA